MVSKCPTCRIPVSGRNAVPRRVVTITCLVVMSASAFLAAEERLESRGLRLSGNVAGAAGGVDCVALVGAAAVGYHFSRRTGVELEVAHVSPLGPHDSVMGHGLRSSSFEPARRTIVATANLRGEVQTRVRWLLPYVIGGIGLANVRTRSFGDATRNDLALAAGGGIDFKVSRAIAIGLDLRYHRVLGPAQDLNIARFGTGVSYRF